MAQAELNRSFSEEPPRSLKSSNKKRNALSRSGSKSKKTLWEAIADLRARLPIEDGEKIPTDLARNVDHYLYGAKKNKR